MSPNTTDASEAFVRDALNRVIAAERSAASTLRHFATQGDDDEVQQAFLAQAARSESYVARLLHRLANHPQEEAAHNLTDHLVAALPKFSQSGEVPEQQIVQNLIGACAIESGNSAAYEAIATVAAASGDATVEALARDAQQESTQAASYFLRLVPSRSKIAFNVMTPQEIDPAVETRTADDRIV